jgi:hypothetical protein
MAINCSTGARAAHLHAFSACCLVWSRSLVRRSRSLAELAQAEAGTNSFRSCWTRVSMSSRDAPHHLDGLAGRVLEPPALIARARIARAGVAAYWDGNQAGSHGAAQPPSRSHRGLMPWPARYVRAHGPADDGTIGPVGHERRSVGVRRGPADRRGARWDLGCVQARSVVWSWSVQTPPRAPGWHRCRWRWSCGLSK